MSKSGRTAYRAPLATRLDEWIHKKREHQVRKRGRVPGVIPYIGYGSTEWVRVLGRVLYLSPRISVAEPIVQGKRIPQPVTAQTARVRGWRSFTSVHVPYHPVHVEIDGHPVTEVLSDGGGVIDHLVPVRLAPGWHTVSLRTSSIGTNSADTTESEHYETTRAPIYIVDPRSHFGLISDVDDTILNTALPKPLVAAWNSFVLDQHARTSTPGMPVLYDHLMTRHPGAPVVYLSTGAWNVAPALSRFLERNLYPMGPLLLTDWGPTADRWFRSGKAHKLRELQRLAAEFPDITWLLIGDDGQHDEELYRQFVITHPHSVAAVAIRQLSTGQAVLAGGRSHTRMHQHDNGVPWVYGPDGASLRQQLAKLGLL